VRRTRLADALAGNGAYVSPHDGVELLETFDDRTGQVREVMYRADLETSIDLPPADHRVL
jgi:hypothetical protein